jgi:hypothetical protein
LIAVLPETFISHRLLCLGIELRALASEPRTIQTGNLLLDSQLDSFTAIWESLFLDQRVEALKEPAVNGNCDLAGTHRSITIYHTRTLYVQQPGYTHLEAITVVKPEILIWLPHTDGSV